MNEIKREQQTLEEDSQRYWNDQTEYEIATC